MTNPKSLWKTFTRMPRISSPMLTSKWKAISPGVSTSVLCCPSIDTPRPKLLRQFLTLRSEPLAYMLDSVIALYKRDMAQAAKERSLKERYYRESADAYEAAAMMYPPDDENHVCECRFHLQCFPGAQGCLSSCTSLHLLRDRDDVQVRFPSEGLPPSHATSPRSRAGDEKIWEFSALSKARDIKANVISKAEKDLRKAIDHGQFTMESQVSGEWVR